jgi:hypothetical protein
MTQVGTITAFPWELFTLGNRGEEAGKEEDFSFLPVGLFARLGVQGYQRPSPIPQKNEPWRVLRTFKSLILGIKTSVFLSPDLPRFNCQICP